MYRPNTRARKHRRLEPGGICSPSALSCNTGNEANSRQPGRNINIPPLPRTGSAIAAIMLQLETVGSFLGGFSAYCFYGLINRMPTRLLPRSHRPASQIGLPLPPVRSRFVVSRKDRRRASRGTLGLQGCCLGAGQVLLLPDYRENHAVTCDPRRREL